MYNTRALCGIEMGCTRREEGHLFAPQSLFLSYLSLPHVNRITEMGRGTNSSPQLLSCLIFLCCSRWSSCTRAKSPTVAIRSAQRLAPAVAMSFTTVAPALGAAVAASHVCTKAPRLVEWARAKSAARLPACPSSSSSYCDLCVFSTRLALHIVCGYPFSTWAELPVPHAPLRGLWRYATLGPNPNPQERSC